MGDASTTPPNGSKGGSWESCAHGQVKRDWYGLAHFDSLTAIFSYCLGLMDKIVVL
jgi:hypothetical protein